LTLRVHLSDHAAMGAADPDRIEAEDDLLRAAHAALEMAYAPYSGRARGAALLAPGGEVFTACNVENADARLNQCAERVALAHAVSAGQQKVLALALASSGEVAELPCADCCSVLAEFGVQVWVVAEGAQGPRHRTDLTELLAGKQP
jgi:cytidine deaminase